MYVRVNACVHANTLSLKLVCVRMCVCVCARVYHLLPFPCETSMVQVQLRELG